jgi:DNA (cytosine-5)-methyltransferase 1
LNHLDLFSGIGGFSLAAEWVWGAEHETVAFCEINEAAQKRLKKHWPNVPVYDDVRRLHGTDFAGVELITGGFPCQDISVAGAQAGIEAERSGLWSELCRLVSEIRPRYALMENVTNLLAGNEGRWFSRVLGDLAEIGYDAEWHCVSASSVGAPHIRDRVWILAYPAGIGWNILQDQKTYNFARECLQNNLKSGYRWKRETGGHSMERVGWTVEPGICGSNDDVPERMDRLHMLGNAIVPQVAFAIMKQIKEHDEQEKARENKTVGCSPAEI